MTDKIDAATLKAAVPPLSGHVTMAGLQGRVTVHRDAWGIPHIKAGSDADAYRALGFVHAQDRLFQMELTLRRAIGKAAEWLGAEAAESDILVRRLGMEAACRRDFAALGDEARAMLVAYVAGVNAFIASDAPLAIEYTLLQARPAPWEPWHSIAVMRRLGLLMGSIWFKLWRMLALPVVGAQEAMGLRYDDGGRDLLTMPTGAVAERWHADLAALAPAVTALLASMGAETGGDETGGGSNNWAVGPAHTSTGRPVLAGDPHRVFELPGMYTQHHLACDSFDMIGLTVPGVPGFPHFGHNAQVAYCVTHAFMDIHDLFLERFDAGGTKALFKDAWEDVRIRQDSIAVRGAEPRVFDIVETRHGPVIAGDPASGSALTLRSVQFAETDLSFDCLPRMPRARSVAELYAMSEGWGLIDHNLVAGDTAGTIGHLVRARLPIRGRDSGWLPMPGWTGAHEWQGWIAHKDMPCVIDPPTGIIVTANNRVVEDSDVYLNTDCHPPYRAARILERVQALLPFSPGDAASVHGDLLSANALLLRDHVAALPPPSDAKARALQQALAAWDGRMEPGAHAPSLYIALRRALTALLAQRSGLGDAVAHAWAGVSPGISPQGQLWWTLPTKLRQNDTGLLGGWSWAQMLEAALAVVAQDPPTQAWGEVHQSRLTHALSGAFPEAAALLNPRSLPIGGDTDTVMANGLACAAGPQATYGALSRYVFDVGNWDACEWVVFHGVSGHPGSAHYADQVVPWSACRMVPMLYDWARIAAEAETTQVLSAG